MGVLYFRRNFDFRFRFLEGDTPDSCEESGHALHAFHLPRLHLFQRAHEHFVETQRIGSVFGNDVVRVHDLAAGLGHFLTVLAKDQALVDEFLEWLGGSGPFLESLFVYGLCVRQTDRTT